jgi:hypothetical protein
VHSAAIENSNRQASRNCKWLVLKEKIRRLLQAYRRKFRGEDQGFAEQEKSICKSVDLKITKQIQQVKDKKVRAFDVSVSPYHVPAYCSLFS